MRTVHLEDDQYVDSGQDESSDEDLSLHTQRESLVGHGQRNHLIVLQESLHVNLDWSSGGKRRDYFIIFI